MDFIDQASFAEKYLTKSKIFLIASLTAGAGLGFGFEFGKVVSYICAMVGLLAIVVGWGKREFMVSGLMGIVLAGSILFSQAHRPIKIDQYYGKKQELTVLIVTDPEAKDKTLNSLAILEAAGENKIPQNVRVSLVLARYPEYEYGARLKLKGKLEQADEYSRKDNVSGQIVFPDVLLEDPGHANKFKAQLYKLKKLITLAINRTIPEPESGFMGGLLLGTKKISQEILDNFRTTGTSHIVAVSGFNVTIVALFLDQLLKKFGRNISFYASMLGIFGFVIITGASASVVRAGIMGCLGLVATKVGRLSSSSNAIVFAAAVMLIQQPALLQFDIGFQLSFSALAGLLYVQPYLEELFPNAPGWVKNFAMPTIAAQISTTPISLFHFGNFSLISVFANVLVLPFISFSMLLGFISVVCYFIWPLLGSIAGSTAWLMLKYILWAIAMCAKIPLASLKNIPFPLPAFIIYYIILITILIWKPKPDNYFSS